MDRKLRTEIVAEVRKAMTEAALKNEEVWLSADSFLKQFQMFSKDWLRRYGHSLPRKRAVVIDEQGRRHLSGWAYPRNQVQRMISDGEIGHLRCLCVIDKADSVLDFV